MERQREDDDEIGNPVVLDTEALMKMENLEEEIESLKMQVRNTYHPI